jgi:hypothetical protein
MFFSSTEHAAFSWEWRGSAWDASATACDLSGDSNPAWFTLKANPINDELLCVCVAGGKDLDTAYWSGSTWTLHTEHTGKAGLDTDAQRSADFAWEPTGSKGLLVFGKSAGKIAYQTYTAPNTWGAKTETLMGANIHPWVQLRRNTRTVSGDTLILGLVLEATALDLGAIRWNGTTFTVIGASTITADTSTDAYECFEVEFMNFGAPTEFTCEVELSGTANAQNWTQLDWTTDLSFTTSSVTTKLQLYNYTAGQYPTNGNGYIAHVIGQTDVTKNQTITVNPTNFTDTGRNWKIKITGTKATTTQFELKIDWIEFKVAPSEVCRLNISNNFTIDLSTYPREYLHGIEILIKYNATENAEKWFLKAYNWTASSFNNVGFNNTEGDQPTLNEWKEYAITVTGNWADYVRDDGVMRIEFFDEGLRTNQTIIKIDYFGARAIIDGTCLDLKNSSSLTLHIVAIWITNATIHQRYSVDLFMNSGESTEYLRVDISLPQDDFIAKVITERGNTAVFSND